MIFLCFPTVQELTGRPISVLWSMFGIVIVFNAFLFFVGFNYSEMANLGSQMDCNICWTCLELPKIQTNMGPGLLFITEILQIT